jgi:hypothetical protein
MLVITLLDFDGKLPKTIIEDRFNIFPPVGSNVRIHFTLHPGAGDVITGRVMQADYYFNGGAPSMVITYQRLGLIKTGGEEIENADLRP